MVSPGTPLAVLPWKTARRSVESALAGIYQAFTSAYPVDLMPYVTRTPPYVPIWNWNGTHCAIGHGFEVLAYYVKDLRLDESARDGAGSFSYTILPPGPRPVLEARPIPDTLINANRDNE